MFIEPGLYVGNIIDIVLAVNNKLRKGIGAQKYENNGTQVSIDKITQNISISLSEEHSVSIIQSSDLRHMFGCDLEKNSDKQIFQKYNRHSIYRTVYELSVLYESTI